MVAMQKVFGASPGSAGAGSGARRGVAAQQACAAAEAAGA